MVVCRKRLKTPCSVNPDPAPLYATLLTISRESPVVCAKVMASYVWGTPTAKVGKKNVLLYSEYELDFWLDIDSTNVEKAHFVNI